MKKGGKGKAIAISILVFLLAVVIVIVCAIGSRDTVTGKPFQVKDPLKWFNSWGKDKDNQDGPGIQLMSYSLAVEDYAVNGIAETALAAGTVRAEYSPDNASNKRTNWAWRWAGNKTWSTNKQVTDYVEFTPAANGEPSLTYSVKQWFGDTIIIECSSQANPGIKASTTIDKMVVYTAMWGDGSIQIDYGENIDLFYDLYDNGDLFSVKPDKFIARNVTVSLSQDFIDYLEKETDYMGTDTSTEWNFETVTEPIPLESLHLGAYVDHLATYYNISTWAYRVTATIDCYYKDKLMYSFTDVEDVELSPSFYDHIAIPVTNVNIIGGDIVLL